MIDVSDHHGKVLGSIIRDWDNAPYMKGMMIGANHHCHSL